MKAKVSVLAIACLTLFSVLEAHAEQLLWSKLGLLNEVQNSELGMNPSVTGPLTFTNIVHGSGVALASGTSSIEYDQPLGNNFPDAGTIEFWWKPQKGENSSTGSHFAERNPFILRSDATNSGGFGLFSIGLNAYGHGGGSNKTHVYFIGRSTPSSLSHGGSLLYDLNYTAGDLLHVALTWDTALGSDAVKVYFDGELGMPETPVDFSSVVQTIQDHILSGGTYDLELLRRSKRPDGAANQIDSGQFVDNFKILDFAKTDFSDRFTENTIPEPTSFTLLTLGGTILLRRRVA